MRPVCLARMVENMRCRIAYIISAPRLQSQLAQIGSVVCHGSRRAYHSREHYPYPQQSPCLTTARRPVYLLTAHFPNTNDFPNTISVQSYTKKQTYTSTVLFSPCFAYNPLLPYIQYAKNIQIIQFLYLIIPIT